MKITGELLKAERIKRNLSVQDVAYALKLSARIISAIENSQLEELPAKTFVRGFVKSYADYLKIDSDAVLKQFHEEMGSTHPVPKTVFPANTSTEIETVKQSKNVKPSYTQNFESIGRNTLDGGLTKRNVIYFAVVTLLVVAIAIINKIANHYQNEIPQVTDATAEGVPVNAEITVEASNSVSPTGTVSKAVAATSAVVSVSGSAASTGATSPIVTAASGNTAGEKSKGVAVEVLIEAKKDSFIDYAKGNTADFKRLSLKANTYQILKSTAGLHLRAGDGSAISLTVNGVSKGPMSNTNKYVEVTF